MLNDYVKSLCMPWLKEHPSGASAFQWYKIDKMDKEKYPIRHYIMEQILYPVATSITRKYKDIRHRIKTYPYSAACIPTGLPDAPYYPDISLILHASFHYFQKIVESYNEDTLEYYKKIQNYSVSSENPVIEQIKLDHKKTQLTQCFLYNWWVRERPARISPLDAFYNKTRPFDFSPLTFYLAHKSEQEEIKKHPHYSLFLEWEEKHNESLKIEKEWREEDEFMLKTLISFLHKMEW